MYYAEVIAFVLTGVGVVGYFDRKNLKAVLASLETKADADLKRVIAYFRSKEVSVKIELSKIIADAKVEATKLEADVKTDAKAAEGKVEALVAKIEADIESLFGKKTNTAKAAAAPAKVAEVKKA